MTKQKETAKSRKLSDEVEYHMFILHASNCMVRKRLEEGPRTLPRDRQSGT